MDKTVRARLSIDVFVDCPHCENFINLMDDRDTGGVDLNEEGRILSQACPSGSWIDEHKKFELDDVTCSECNNEFSVRELEW